MSIFDERIKELQNLFSSLETNAFLVSAPSDIFYLTGFKGLSSSERESILLINKDRAFLLIPELYKESAQKYSSYVIFIDNVQNGKSLFTALKSHFHPNIILGIEEDNLTIRELKLLKNNYELRYKDIGAVLEAKRQTKDKTELAFIKKAAEITDKTFFQIVRYFKPQTTEKNIARTLSQIMEDLGADKPAFEPIVASGVTSSLPHYFASNRKINSGILLIDAGASFKGYNADLTRTFYLGKPDNLFKSRYYLLLKTQQRLISLLKPGLNEESVWLKTIENLNDQSEYFVHGTGHGVGIDIHEPPYFRSGRKNKLVPNMTVTIEPGIYYPKWGGIRIEDLVLITKNGCRMLSKMTRKFEDMIIST